MSPTLSLQSLFLYNTKTMPIPASRCKEARKTTQKAFEETSFLSYGSTSAKFYVSLISCVLNIENQLDTSTFFNVYVFVLFLLLDSKILK